MRCDHTRPTCPLPIEASHSQIAAVRPVVCFLIDGALSECTVIY